MNQNIWGPHLWFSLHTISFNYPLMPKEDDKEFYKNFFTNLQHVIPCSICKKNYIRHIKEHPISQFLDNRKTFVYWVIDMHNMVNAEIGKKILSYDVVMKKYEEVYKKKIILDYSNNSLSNNSLPNNNLPNNNLSNNSLPNNSIQNNKENKLDYIFNDNRNFINILFIVFIILLIINFMKIKKII